MNEMEFSTTNQRSMAVNFETSRVEEVHFKLDEERLHYVDLPNNIKELAIVGGYFLSGVSRPRIALVDDDGNFVKMIHPKGWKGYITVDNGVVDFIDPEDYKNVVWC